MPELLDVLKLFDDYIYHQSLITIGTMLICELTYI